MEEEKKEKKKEKKQHHQKSHKGATLPRKQEEETRSPELPTAISSRGKRWVLSPSPVAKFGLPAIPITTTKVALETPLRRLPEDTTECLQEANRCRQHNPGSILFLCGSIVPRYAQGSEGP